MLAILYEYIDGLGASASRLGIDEWGFPPSRSRQEKLHV